jgi:peroxiredoxin
MMPVLPGKSRRWSHLNLEVAMRYVVAVLTTAAIFIMSARADDQQKEAPKVVLKSPDGKKAYDLEKLTAEGPVLVRLTCACSGCDAELPYFKKLRTAYDAKGFKILAIFQEEPATLEPYLEKNDVHFLSLADPKGAAWKTFDAKTMPTNILIDKGGKVVKVIAGCTKDGKNAQILSAEVSKLLNTEEAKITSVKK